MQLSKQTKSYIYVVIITMIVLLLAFLLFQNITAINNNNNGKWMQRPTYANEPIALYQGNEILAQQNVNTQQDTQSEGVPYYSESNKKSLHIIIKIIVIVGMIVGIGASVYFFLQYLKNRSHDEKKDALEPIREIMNDASPYLQKDINYNNIEPDEEVGNFDEHPVSDVVYAPECS